MIDQLPPEVRAQVMAEILRTGGGMLLGLLLGGPRTIRAAFWVSTAAGVVSLMAQVQGQRSPVGHLGTYASGYWLGAKLHE